MQGWLGGCHAEEPDFILFENVKGYEISLLSQAMKDKYDFKWSMMDPRHFNVGMSRPRVYVLMWLKERYEWVGDDSKGWMAMMECTKNHQSPSFDPAIFAAFPDDDSSRPLTPSENKHLDQYKAVCPTAKVVDLSQSGSRPVNELADGSMPCLRTSSNLYLPSSNQFLSGRQLLRAMGFPVQAADARKIGVRQVHLEWLDLKNKHFSEMAGNGMFMPCVSLAVLAMLLFVQPRDGS